MPPVYVNNKISRYFLCPSPQSGKAHFALCHSMFQLRSYKNVSSSQTAQNVLFYLKQKFSGVKKLYHFGQANTCMI